MATLDETSEDIQRQMAAVRAELEQAVNEAFTSARTLTDWRHHFREHPLLFCAASAAVGFLLVPRRGPAPRSDVEPGSAGPEARAAAQPAAGRPVLAALLGVAANLVVKELTRVAMRSGREMLEEFIASQTSRRHAGQPAQDTATKPPKAGP